MIACRKTNATSQISPWTIISFSAFPPALSILHAFVFGPGDLTKKLVRLMYPRSLLTMARGTFMVLLIGFFLCALSSAQIAVFDAAIAKIRQRYILTPALSAAFPKYRSELEGPKMPPLTSKRSHALDDLKYESVAGRTYKLRDECESRPGRPYGKPFYFQKS